MGDDVVVADRDQVRLTDGVVTDLNSFRGALEETTAHDHGESDVCVACITPLRKAVATYRGEFMAGFSIRDTPEYEDWTRSTAEGLRMAVGRAYERLATALAAEGDYRSAIEAVNSWLELDPLREPGYRQLMILSAWAGDGAGATEAYRRCVATLNRELGVDPLEETTELHEAILDDDLPPAPGLRKRIVARRVNHGYESVESSGS
jgi:DNA-binding SARP family transcriptional activator